MLSIIKTALITIIISFISGVLLDTYKNFAPRILCAMRRVKNNKIKNKNSKTYLYTVSNASNKILHDININVQAPDNSLKVEDAKISNGLKFELINENNIYNVSIPFLSKDDEFSLKLLVANSDGVNNKPIINLRSPEAFKMIYSNNKKIKKKRRVNGDTAYLGVGSKISDLFHNKKLIITIASILIIVYGVIIGIEYFDKDNNNANTTNKDTSTQEPLNNVKTSNSNSNSNGKTTQNSNNDNSPKKSTENKKNENLNTKTNNANSTQEPNKGNSNKSNTSTSNEKNETNENKKDGENKGTNNTKENSSTSNSNKTQQEESKEGNKTSNTDNSNNNNENNAKSSGEDKNGEK